MIHVSLDLPSLLHFASLTLVKRDATLQFSATSGFRRFDWTPMFYLHLVGWIARSARWWAHSKFDFSGHCHKSLLYIHRIFGRRFQKWYAELIGIFLFTTKYNYTMRIVINLNKLQNIKEMYVQLYLGRCIVYYFLSM